MLYSWRKAWTNFLWLLVLLLVVAAPSLQAASWPSSLSFVFWADIHQGHPDTPENAWPAAFAQGIDDGLASFFILGGDMVDNKDLPQEQFVERMRNFTQGYARKLVDRGKPLIFTYGNNDFYKNYNTDPANMRPTFEVWSQSLGDKYYLNELGNGIYPQELGGATLFTLNSIIMAAQNSYDPSQLYMQRQETLNWLDANLKALESDDTAIIVSHIPPCFDAFNHRSMWDKQTLMQFHQILTEVDCNVIILSAHTHRNEMHALYIDDYRSIPIIVSGAISQKYGYNANYRRFTVEYNQDNGEPSRLSWALRYLEFPQNSRVDLVDNPITTDTWNRFLDALTADQEVYRDYVRDFYASRDDWQELARQSKLRQAILGEVFVASGWDDSQPGLYEKERQEFLRRKRIQEEKERKERERQEKLEKERQKKNKDILDILLGL